MNGTFPRRSFHRKQAKMKGLLQNSPNEKIKRPAVSQQGVLLFYDEIYNSSRMEISS